VTARLRLSLPKFAALWVFLALTSLFVAPSPAAASPARASLAGASPAAALLRGERIVAAARSQHGKPYRRGASGPAAFDCSGLSGYAYRAAHIKLPRTANGQFRAAHPVSRAAARPGDLVFWVQGRHAYHVAVYAGAGRVWHAPKPGDRVRLAAIWSPREVRFGRFGA
jgi:cell wall-associated NlpC family hydrolase